MTFDFFSQKIYFRICILRENDTNAKMPRRSLVVWFFPLNLFKTKTLSLLCVKIQIQYLSGRCGDTCIDFNENYLAWELPGIGRYLIFMAIQGFVYLFLLFLIESGVVYRIIYSIKGQNNVGFTTDMYEKTVEAQEADDDVLAESKRINNTPLENLLETDSLVIQGLSKQYGHNRAVDNISIGISNQECFGLLGQNGAGKTSTFKMLTGDLTVTSGNAYLHVYDIKQHLKQVLVRFQFF